MERPYLILGQVASAARTWHGTASELRVCRAWLTTTNHGGPPGTHRVRHARAYARAYRDASLRPAERACRAVLLSLLLSSTLPAPHCTPRHLGRGAAALLTAASERRREPSRAMSCGTECRMTSGSWRSVQPVVRPDRAVVHSLSTKLSTGHSMPPENTGSHPLTPVPPWVESARTAAHQGSTVGGKPT